MFVLNSNITIGAFKRVMPHEVRINKSIYEYCDKAIIKVPATSRLKRAGKVITESAETAKQITEGMPVTIQLGYNGNVKTEFTGFVRRVNFTIPCEIECEGYSYQLRIRTYQRTFTKVQLVDVLKYLVQGTGIVLSPQIPGFIIDTLPLTGQSGTEILEHIKELSKNTIRFFFTDNVLYAGLIYLDEKNGITYTSAATVKYKLGWNVIKDDSLKLREAKNQDVTVKIVWLEKNGVQNLLYNSNKTVIGGAASSGKAGETQTLKIKQIKDRQTMQGIANAKQNQLSYNGYEGKITAFLQPYCHPGYKAVITDDKYPERNGSYLVESTEVIYGMGGARRIAGIGLKL